jgi:hypothetical protein
MEPSKLEKEVRNYLLQDFDSKSDSDVLMVMGFAEPRENLIKILKEKNTKLEAQMSLKIINCIKSHLCKQDEDYDKPIISPKFLSDALDQMAMDGFKIK